MAGFAIEMKELVGDYPGLMISPAQSDSSGTVQVNKGALLAYGDGSGSYVGADGRSTNYGDGSGSYSDGTVSISNYGDGSGAYEDGELSIANYGDGTGAVNGTAIDVDPITTVSALGVFPPMGVLKPIESCGTTITIEDGVLFDFDKSDLRPDSKAILDALAKALTDAKAPTAQIGGHTDSKGTPSYNQTLSKKRAASVVAALKERKVATKLEAKGYGQTMPVAPNEIKGKDNLAGRQLNRRVEILVPTF